MGGTDEGREEGRDGEGRDEGRDEGREEGRDGEGRAEGRDEGRESDLSWINREQSMMRPRAFS